MDENQNHELPRGLENYEFQRELTPSRDIPHYYHLLNKVNPETFKPFLTEDNQPDKKDFSWSELFDKDQPIELEIGSGKGGFMIEYGKKKPEINLLGSEWDPKWAMYSGQRINKNNLNNVSMLRGDVFYFLRDYVPSKSISAYHMYFPDPWPKKRHHKNRLIRPDFLNEVKRCAKHASTPFFWGTDHAEYNEIAMEYFEATSFIRVKNPKAAPTEGIMTNFEKKYVEEGRPIYRVELEILNP